MDGETENIETHFEAIYSELYNSANDEDEVNNIKGKVENMIKDVNIEDVEKVTPEIVEKAAQKLNPGKSDPVFTFSSDCTRHGTNKLYSLLASLYQGFKLHAHVSQGLLISTLVPIVKDQLASISLSKKCSFKISTLGLIWVR